MACSNAQTIRRDSAFGIRISDAARAKLHRDAEAHGLTIGRYLEELIMEGRLSHTDYFAQQAAVSAFTAAALTASIAAKLLGPQEATALRERGAAMVRRRALKAGVVEKIGNHSFRGTGITTFLLNDGSLELAQEMANHASPRTTKLYDRRDDKITQDAVERIRIE